MENKKRNSKLPNINFNTLRRESLQKAISNSHIMKSYLKIGSSQKNLKNTKLPKLKSKISYQKKKSPKNENFEILTIMQNEMIKRVEKNESKYFKALNKIYENIKKIKKKTNFIKVNNGKTTEEYLRYRKIIDNRDKKKRLDNLALLNTLGYSFKYDDYNVDFYYHNYPHVRKLHPGGRIYPLI